MVEMRLVFRSVLLCLLVSISSAAPPGLRLKEASFNATLDPLLSSRSLEEREVFLHCNDVESSGLLAQAIQDASAIMSNMVAHLDLAISLYNEDGSGELKADKATKAQRTFDEHNAFATYRMFITNHYKAPGDAENLAGLNKLKDTRNLANTMQSQYAAYVAGRSVVWTRGGFPYVNIFCNDVDLYSETNSAGLTYTQDRNLPNPSTGSDGSKIYWVSQSKGAPLGAETWVPRLAVCALQDGAVDQKRFGVPAMTGLNAYVHGAIYGLIEETMVFCQIKFAQWIATDTSRTASGLHYRNLHVDIGSSPTTAQKTAMASLLAQADFTSSPPRSLRWLSDFLVSTMIHESTHSAAFVGVGNGLLDVPCRAGANAGAINTQTSSDPGCMAQIAKGTNGRALAKDKTYTGETQGHKDAEAFAKYAMATWVNVVSWYGGFMPKDRDT